MRYKSDIQGLRGIAVLLVLLFHLSLVDETLDGLTLAIFRAKSVFQGGFVGVDMFFVISGYIIFRRYHASLRKGSSRSRTTKFSYRQFLVRRIRRLFAAALTMSLSTVLAVAVFQPSQLHSTLSAFKSQLCLVANHHFYDSSGYFSDSAIQKPLLHTWSLAVEEQFYLLVPLVLLACFRWLSRAQTLIVLSLIAVASFGCNISWMQSGNPDASYFLLPARAWQILVGGIAGLISLRKRQLWFDTASGLIGILAIGFATTMFSELTPYPGWAGLLPVAGSLLVLVFGRRSKYIRRIFSAKFLEVIGTLSYSLYLWHWPVFCIGLTVFPRDLFWLFALGVTFLLAYASYYLVEQPLRYRAWATKPILIAHVALLCITLAITWRTQEPPPKQVANTQHENLYFQVTLKNIADGNVPVIGDSTVKASIATWGDSHMMPPHYWLEAYLRRNKQSAVCVTHSSAPPILCDTPIVNDKYGLGDDAPKWSRKAIDYFEDQEIHTVIMGSYWRRETVSFVYDTIGELKRRGVAQVIVLEDSPTLEKNAKAKGFPSVSIEFGSRREQPDPQKVREAGGIWAPVRKHLLSSDKKSFQTHRNVDGENVCLYRDSHHFSREGAILIYNHVLPEPLEAAIASRESGD